jgi:BlaI family penicillinase repressor
MKPKISSAEWEVMNVVWDRSPVTALEVYNALPHAGWKQKTVNTFLTRLGEKGVLKVTKDGNLNLYAPRLERKDCVTHEGDSFLQRVFGGAPASLMMHFCERADLTPEEIRQLERILKAKKAGK